MSKFFGENAGRQLIRELFNTTGTALQGKADLVNGKVPSGQIPNISWNTLTDKPFDDVESSPAYSYTIPVSPTDGIVAEEQLGGMHTLYRVGDAVSLSTLVGATATLEVTNASGQTTTEQVVISTRDLHDESSGYGSIKHQKFYIVSAPEDNWSVGNFTVAEAGLYFGTFAAYDADGVETTYKLSRVYKTTSAMSLPADTSGIDSVDGGNGMMFYRVGDAVSSEDLIGASCTMRIEQNGTATTGTDVLTSERVFEQDSYILVVGATSDVPVVVVTSSDNTEIEGISVAHAGTYFAVLTTSEQTITTQSLVFSAGVDATLPANTASLAQLVEDEHTASRMILHRVGDAFSMEQLTNATLTESLLADSTVTNNTTILEYGQNMGWIDENAQDVIVMGGGYGAISVLKTVTELTQESLSPGLYLTEVVSYSKDTTPDTMQRIVTSVSRDTQYTTQRLDAKYVEADWNHMINQPFYEEVIPRIDLQQPDYATADGVSFDVDYAGMATMPAKAVRVSDYYTQTQLSGAVCTMLFGDESDDYVVDNYLVTANHWYGMFRDGIPWFLVTDTDDVTVNISDSNAPTFSVALPTAGIYFLYVDASAPQGGLSMRTVSIEKDAQTIVHQIERKYVPIPDIEIPDPMPAVTAADDGKFMVVENGVWTAQAVPSAEAMVF